MRPMKEQRTTSSLSGRKTRRSSSRKQWCAACFCLVRTSDYSNAFQQDGTIKRTLFDSGGKPVGTVELEARYIPVPLKLEPRESVNSEREVRFSSHTTKTYFRSGCSSSPAPRWWRDSWCRPRRYVLSLTDAFHHDLRRRFRQV